MMTACKVWIRTRCAQMLVLPLAVAGCDTGTAERGWTERDSAGVTIVESVRPQWLAGDPSAWRLEADAVIAHDTSGAIPFRRITDVLPLSNGGLVIIDAYDNSLRWFDAQGLHARTVTPVDLPVVVTGLTRLYLAADRLVAAQRGTEPSLVFRTDGEFIEAVALPAPRRFPFIAQVRIHGDGRRVGVQPPTGLLPRSGVWTENARFLSLPVDTSRADVLFAVPGVRFARVAGGVEPVAWGPSITFDFTDSTIVASFPAMIDIGVWSTDGTPLRRVRRSSTPTPVEPWRVDSLRAWMRRAFDALDEPEIPELIERRQQLVDELVVADTFAAHGRIVADRDGGLWVERIPPAPLLPVDPHVVRADPSPWDIFDRRGVWLGTIDIPPNVWITHVAADRVAGILREEGRPELGVAYRILKPPTDPRTTDSR